MNDGEPDELVSPAHAARLDRLAELQHHRARIDAEQQRLLAAIAADPDPHPHLHWNHAKEWVREEVACALHLAPRTAGSWLHEATELVHRLPATLAAMDRGDIGFLYARSLVDAIRNPGRRHRHPDRNPGPEAGGG